MFGIGKKKQQKEQTENGDLKQILDLAANPSLDPAAAPDIEVYRYLHTWQPESVVGRKSLADYDPVLNNVHVTLGNFSVKDARKIRFQGKAYMNLELMTKGDLDWDDLKAYLAAERTLDAEVSRGIGGWERSNLQLQRRELALQASTGSGLLQRGKRAFNRFLGIAAGAGGGESQQ
jgi:hypothetical protein